MSDSKLEEVSEEIELPSEIYSDNFEPTDSVATVFDDSEEEIEKEIEEEEIEEEKIDNPIENEIKNQHHFFINLIKPEEAKINNMYRLLKKGYNINVNHKKIGPYESIEERDKDVKKLFGPKLYYRKKGENWYIKKKKNDINVKIDNDSWLVYVKQKHSTLMDPTKSSVAKHAAAAAGGKTKRRRQNKTVRFSIFSFPFACSKEDFRKTKKSQRKNRKTRRK